jgi:predicted PurR-regulated permease PerM
MSFSSPPDPDNAGDSQAPSGSPNDETAIHRLCIDLSWRAIARVAGALALGWLLLRLLPVMLWLVIALMFVAALNPVVRRWQERMRRPWAIGAIAGTALLVLFTLAAIIVPVALRQGQKLLVNVPTYARQLEATAQRSHVKIDVHGTVQRWMEHLPASLLDYSWSVGGTLLGTLTVFVLTIYFLIEGPQVATGLTSLLPRGERLWVRRMFGEIGDQVGHYMRGQLITSALAGIFSLVVLTALGVPEAPALAGLMVVADVIPVVGPFLATIPAVLMALTKNLTTAWLTLLAYTVYLQVEANVIAPRIYGKTMRLSPLVVLIAFLVGTALMGMAGAVLALPVAAAIPILKRYYEEWRDRDELPAEVPLPGATG